MTIETIAPFDKSFKRLSKKYPSLKKDLQKLNASLLDNPTQGKSLGDNCYKIRMAIGSKSKGKSGGARVITCVRIVADKIHLLDIFDKSDMENIDDEYLSELRDMVE